MIDHVGRSAALIALLALSSPGAAGDDLIPRIVNGIHTQAYPTTGALLVDDGGRRYLRCSGVLIGCSAFLTAAHCVCPGSRPCEPYTPIFSVFLQHAGLFSASRIDVHPDYRFAVQHDVAVVTLAQPVTGIEPSRINDASGPPSAGMGGVIAGFGLSRGTRDDAGIKRAGNVEISSCYAAVPQTAHVCWVFERPLGCEGEDASACYGDSGGPLFVDFGSGPLAAGVTSGGTNATCVTPTLVFDADVFASAAFIQSVADVSDNACGSISQVGDGDTKVLAAGPGALSLETRRCRTDVLRHVSSYVRSGLRAMQACLDGVNAGAINGTCPDAATMAVLERAASRISAAHLARRCSPAVVSGGYFDGVCAGAADAEQLRQCILDAGDAAVAGMLNVEYAEADPSGVLPDEGARCQEHIGEVMRDYAAGVLRALLRCRRTLDAARSEACPDETAEGQIRALAEKVSATLREDCSDEQIVGLDADGGFGGRCQGVATASVLGACQVDEHDSELGTLLAVVRKIQTARHATFDVTPGSARLNLALNGVDAYGNEISLYAGAGEPPTTETYDFSSNNGGCFEAIEVVDPVPGRWHVLVSDDGGTEPAFQLTVTEFANR